MFHSGELPAVATKTDISETAFAQMRSLAVSPFERKPNRQIRLDKIVDCVQPQVRRIEKRYIPSDTHICCKLGFVSRDTRQLCRRLTIKSIHHLTSLVRILGGVIPVERLLGNDRTLLS